MIDIIRGLVAFRAADWLSLAAAPTFALMAVVTGIVDGGPHQMSCSAAMRMSPLTGMVPMYALMSAFHFTPWLRLISRWTKRRRGRPPRVAFGHYPRTRCQQPPLGLRVENIAASGLKLASYSPKAARPLNALWSVRGPWPRG